MAKRARKKTRHRRNIRNLGALSGMFDAVPKAVSKVARKATAAVKPRRKRKTPSAKKRRATRRRPGYRPKMRWNLED